MFFKKKPLTVEVGPAKPGETAPRRNVLSKDKPWTTADNIAGIDTAYKHLKMCVKRWGDRPAMSTRPIKTVHTDEKLITRKVDGKEEQVPKKWIYYELGSYSSISFKELDVLVSEIASGLIYLGIKPNDQDRLHIYARTQAIWLQTFLAAASQGIPVVTAYDTLGEEGLIHSMTQTETVAVLVDGANLHTLVNPLKKATSIRTVIYIQDIADANYSNQVAELKAVRDNISVITFEDLLKFGRSHPVPASPPRTEDTALIMYTSGSTGTPKGVVLLNSNVCAGVGGVSGVVGHDIIVPGDKILAFLPLAHILELTLELASLNWGSTLGYGDPKTLTELSVRNCVGDIREFKPTIMIGVPAVWENVRKGILAKVRENPAIVQKIFWSAFYAKQSLHRYGLPLPLVDSLIFKKVREATGGQLKFVFNGGAPLSKDTQEFITLLVAPLVTGYGLTETCANASLMSPAYLEMGTQGAINTSLTAKLVDVSDAGYLAKNNQGEVLLKGGPISPRYFQNEEETNAAFTEDGWFKTGDIGEWTPTGSLRLIDRKKNLVKTLHGEYIALEKLESLYRYDAYVANICVYADQNRVKPIAIIVPMERAVKELCEKLNISHHEDVAHDKRISEAIHRSLLQTGHDQGLRGFELIAGVVIAPTEWTPQNGFLSSAQKLQRRKILEANKSEIERVYNESS